MSDWYQRLYRDDAMDRPGSGTFCPVRRYDVMALIYFLLDPEGRETRYYGC
jgi:hypothetical protein